MPGSTLDMGRHHPTSKTPILQIKVPHVLGLSFCGNAYRTPKVSLDIKTPILLVLGGLDGPRMVSHLISMVLSAARPQLR